MQHVKLHLQTVVTTESSALDSMAGISVDIHSRAASRIAPSSRLVFRQDRDVQLVQRRQLLLLYEVKLHTRVIDAGRGGSQHRTRARTADGTLASLMNRKK